MVFASSFFTSKTERNLEILFDKKKKKKRRKGACTAECNNSTERDCAIEGAIPHERPVREGHSPLGSASRWAAEAEGPRRRVGSTVTTSAFGTGFRSGYRWFRWAPTKAGGGSGPLPLNDGWHTSAAELKIVDHFHGLLPVARQCALAALQRQHTKSCHARHER